MFPKPRYKKQNRRKIHDFSEEVKQKEYEDAGGMCRTCGQEPITQYHHINEKGMGGGRGLGIQINCLGVGDKCHNHDDIDFLHKANEILKYRTEKMFNNNSGIYSWDEIYSQLGMCFDEFYSQIHKGFLREYFPGCIEINDIKRWLGVSA